MFHANSDKQFLDEAKKRTVNILKRDKNPDRNAVKQTWFRRNDTIPWTSDKLDDGTVVCFADQSSSRFDCVEVEVKRDGSSMCSKGSGNAFHYFKTGQYALTGCVTGEAKVC